MSAANGQEEAMDAQQRRQAENAGIKNGHRAAEEFKEELSDFVDTVTETDATPIQKCGLENFLSKDFVLAYYDSKDVEAMRWYMYIVIEKILAEAPDESDHIKGDEEMEFLYGIDPQNTITEPLSLNDKNALHAARKVIVGRTSRGKEGFQQKIFKTNVSESRVVRPEEQKRGGLLGKLRRK